MSSIDQKELEKFEKISQGWWNKKGEFGILHQINPIRIEYIIEKIISHFNIHNESFSKISILDVGCGGGLIAAPLAKYGFNVTAIDALESNVNIAKSYAKEHNLKVNYLKSTIEELPIDMQYDVIICLEVIEHVDNLPTFVLNLTKHIKSKGMMIISTINRSKKAYLFGIIFAEHVLKWVPKNTHKFSKFVKPSELYELLKNTKMSIKELKGLVYNIRDDKWQLSEDIDVNYFAYLIF